MKEAQIKEIGPYTLLSAPIKICWNSLNVNIVQPVRSNGKYKKVTLQLRQALIHKVKNGSSIINAARTLKINYSTAKSIFQNLKAKASGKCKRKRFIQTDSEEESGLGKEEELQQT